VNGAATNPSEGLLERAQTAFKVKDYEQALKLTLRFREARPKDPAGAFLLGAIYDR
jgi:Flp pilus assembly protein TadD